MQVELKDVRAAQFPKAERPACISELLIRTDLNSSMLLGYTTSEGTLSPSSSMQVSSLKDPTASKSQRRITLGTHISHGLPAHYTLPNKAS